MQPEYTYATSCDFCGHGDHNRSANWWPADKPPSYSSTGTNEIFRPDVMKTIEKTLNDLSSELRDLSLMIHGKYPHNDRFFAAPGSIPRRSP